MWIDDLEAAIDKDRIGTHWEGCYLEHKDCALLRLIAVARAGRELAELAALAHMDMSAADIDWAEMSGNPDYQSPNNPDADALWTALVAFREAEGG